MRDKTMILQASEISTVGRNCVCGDNRAIHSQHTHHDRPYSRVCSAAAAGGGGGITVLRG